MKDLAGEEIKVGDYFVFARKVHNSAVLGFGRVTAVRENGITAVVTDRYHPDKAAGIKASLRRSDAICLVGSANAVPESIRDFPADVQQN